jgi:hypothetical protein
MRVVGHRQLGPPHSRCSAVSRSVAPCAWRSKRCCDRWHSFYGVPDRSVCAGVISITAVTPNADVTLELVSLAGATVKVSTRAGSAVVTMVATDDEMSYLKAPANRID